MSDIASDVGEGGIAGSDNWFGQAFTTPADAGYALAAVTLKLATAGNNSPGTFAVSVWAVAANGQPGNQLGIVASGIQIGSLPASFTNRTFSTSSSIILYPSSTYLIVLGASISTTNSGLTWGDSPTFDPAATGPGQLGGWTQSTDQGKTWAPLELAYPFQLELDGTRLPTLLDPRRSASGFSVSFQTEQGKNYALESALSVGGPWSPVSTVAGDGTLKTLTDQGASGFVSFYRLRVQ